MTRKEEIKQASIKYQMSVSPVVVGGAAFADEVEIFNINSSFVAGAKWADKTMIEKACEWLENNVEMYNAYNPTVESYYSGKERMLEDFKKAMEE